MVTIIGSVCVMQMVVAELPEGLAKKASAFVGRKVRYLCVAGNMRSSVLEKVAGPTHVLSPFAGNAAEDLASITVCTFRVGGQCWVSGRGL